MSNLNLRPSKETVEYMSKVQLNYTPFLGIFSKRREHTAELGKVTFKSQEMKNIGKGKLTSAITEKEVITIGESSKTFNKAFFGATFKESELKTQSDRQSMHNRVINAYAKDLDKRFINSDGNNGLFGSEDANKITRASVQLVGGTDNLAKAQALITAVSNMIAQSNDTTASESLVIGMFGDKLQAYSRLLIDTGETILSLVKKAIRETYNMEVTFIPVNNATLGTGSKDALMLMAMDMVELNFTSMPKIKNQGDNEEKGYYWANYIVGTAMLDAQEYGALIEQEFTFAT